MSTNRLESFSDGVFAVAITLLVLGIAVPSTHDPGSLAHKLAHNWAQYAAYAVSFVTIGIIWINHHGMISRLRAVDHTILILNLVLLMTVAILPFVTELIAAYLREPHDRDVAAAVYSGAFLVMGVVFSLENGVILLRRADLLAVPLSLDRRRQILGRAAGGVTPYAIAVAVSFVSAYAALAICAALALFYALPIASGYESTTE
ncbi:MAG TPA: TMEM175 family protein [Solirubrobacteraceae bacterium]|nr:TMEM175 family protein [Solirubrobacteraceae bacterium]